MHHTSWPLASILWWSACALPLQLLPEDVPGKSGGAPGNAFELVYISVTDAVHRAVRKVDPVLADWIRYPASFSLPVSQNRPMPKCFVCIA